MSRRSKRLSTLDQEDDKNSTSSMDSHMLYRDSPVRSTRRKVTTIKRAPTPHQTTEHTNYTETSTYINRDRSGLSSALKETDYEGSTWGESDLVRKKLGIDISHISSKNGFSDRQTTYDKSPSSSGYSSEEDYNGHSHSQEGFSRVSHWKKWAQKMKELPWLLFSYPEGGTPKTTAKRKPKCRETGSQEQYTAGQPLEIGGGERGSVIQ
ncbi:PREDICTED: SUN domain-containing protein 2-like, partial [Nanorana parkeri]|uniref:SUN domain-containing protein 2-like n=1 Tax=Nanorana parkeri TaxID=125878 RepID=UPI0008540F97